MGNQIHLRLTSAELRAIKGFAEDQSEPSLSAAIRHLISLGLEAAKSRPRGDIRVVLREIDPAWSGGVPRFGKPIQLASPGSQAMEDLLGE